MAKCDRRQFLESAAGAAVCLSSTAGGLAASEYASATTSIVPPPKISLGSTGIQMSRLGQGTGVHGGRRQSDQTRLGFEQLVALFKHAYARGITFFDMADLYGTHIYFREALRTIPREEITILTKLWWRFDGPRDETSSRERKRMAEVAVERFRHEINTDYLDIVLLHCLQSADWQENFQPYMEALDEAKQKKQIKAVGVSCHHFGALKAAADAPWVDVILARLNPKGVKMDAPTEEVVPVLKRAKENGKGVIGMKILGEGQLSQEKEACVKFAQSVGVLDAMTVGFHTPAQIDDMLGMLHKFPVAGH